MLLNYFRFLFFNGIPPCGAGANVAKYEDTVPVKTLPVPGQSSAKQFYQFSYQLPSISGLYTFFFQCTPKYGRVFCIMLRLKIGYIPPNPIAFLSCYLAVICGLVYHT